MNHDLSTRTVAVIGAGPIGLAAAAHLLERGMSPLVLEAGPGVATMLESFRHVQLFSPWRYNIDAAARRLLEAAGWTPPQLDFLPTAGAMIDRYLAPLAALPGMREAIRFSHTVLDISREGFDKMKSKGRDDAPFVIRCSTAEGVREFRAWAVLDASGNWNKPNPLGANGLPAIGEPEVAARIAYGMPDILGRFRARYSGKRVLVAGAGHSAAGNLLALAKLADEAPGTTIVWTIRGNNFARIFGGGDNDGLPARGALGRRLKALTESHRLEVHANFRSQAIRIVPSSGNWNEAPKAGEGKLTVEGRGANDEPLAIEGIDEIIVATGGRPDLSISAELRLKHDPWIESTEQLAPLIDPNVHSCGTVRPHGHRELEHPEKRFYAVGAKSYGRAPNFLLATGHEQVRSVVAALAGDMAAADAVQLELPETGVCSTQFDEASSGCCSTGDSNETSPTNARKETMEKATACCGPSAQTAQPTAQPTAESSTSTGCATAACGGAPKQRDDACCGLDEKIKDAGGAGCGSEASKAATARASSAACCR